MRPLVLDGQHTRESSLLPGVDHPVEHSRFVRRIGERDIVRVGRERAGKGKGIALEDARAVAQAKRSDVGAESVEARWPELDEVGTLRAS